MHPPGRLEGGPRPGRFDEPDGSRRPGCYNGPKQGLMDLGGSEPHNQMKILDQMKEGNSSGLGIYDSPVGQQPLRCDKPGRFDGLPDQPGRLVLGSMPQGLPWAK